MKLAKLIPAEAAAIAPSQIQDLEAEGRAWLEARAQKSDQLHSLAAAFGSMECQWTPAGKVTRGKTITGKNVGGPFRPEFNPWTASGVDLKLCQRRYGTQAQDLPHACTPSAGWCDSNGNNCTVGPHGYYAGQAAAQFYSDNPQFPLPAALAGLPRPCEVSSLNANDLGATGGYMSVVSSWIRDRTPPPPPVVKVQAVVPSTGTVAAKVAISATGPAGMTCTWASPGFETKYRCAVDVVFGEAGRYVVTLRATTGPGQLQKIESVIYVSASTPGAISRIRLFFHGGGTQDFEPSTRSTGGGVGDIEIRKATPAENAP